MSIDLSDEELEDLCLWVESNVEVRTVKGVDKSDVEYEYLTPSGIRDAIKQYDSLSEFKKSRIKLILRSWRTWKDKEREPSVPHTVTLGTSPWRAERRENPPKVPLGRDDIVWLEWRPGFEHIIHEAKPATSPPVVGGASKAVLTNMRRALSLDSKPCPDCYPELAENEVSISDAESGLTLTVNTEYIDDIPEDAVDAFERVITDIHDSDSQ